MDDTKYSGSRLILFLPLVMVVTSVLTYVAIFAATTMAAQIALVLVIVAIGLIFSTAMLKRDRAARGQ